LPARVRRVLRTGANEQLFAQVFFQLLDGARQRRLFYVQSLSRSREVEFFSDGQRNNEDGEAPSTASFGYVQWSAR
jgi:hypothetical protein